MNKEQLKKRKRQRLALKGIIPNMYKGDATIKTIVAWFGNTTLNPSIHNSLHKYTITFIILSILNAINSKNYKSVYKCKTK
jgi:hypothetical protein